MSISVSDIKFYKALNNNDLDGNGGRISSTQITTNVLENLFPNVTNAERVAGLTRYRKFFMRNENLSEYDLDDTKLWIGTRSLAADYFQFKAGTDSDIQSDADDYTDWAGAGILNTALSSGESTIIVDFDVASGVYDGAEIHIDDGTNEEKLTVDGAPSWANLTATLTISGETQNAYATPASTVVSTVVDLDSLETGMSDWVENGTFTYDEDTYCPSEATEDWLYNKGTVTDDWTLTFSGASDFSCSGANTGSVGSGEITTDFTPANGSSYYFKIDKDGWGGSPANGDTLTFSTTHAGKDIWAKEVVPAATVSYASNVVQLDWEGESA